MTEYQFEGRVINTFLNKEILDRLAGLVVSYKTMTKAKVVKAAREQEGYIKGFLYGLEAAGEIDSEDSDQLFNFFME